MRLDDPLTYQEWLDLTKLAWSRAIDKAFAAANEPIWTVKLIHGRALIAALMEIESGAMTNPKPESK